MTMMRKTVTKRLPSRPVASRAGPSSGRAFALEIPFELRGLASLHGARWEPDHGVFLYRGASLPEALVPYRSQPYSLERRVEETLNDEVGQPRAPTAALRARPHQEEAIAAIHRARAAGLGGFLLADDVGLGKTISAWDAILRMDDVCTVLITCPLAVVAHWRKTIMALGDGGKDVIVMNYERLGKLFELPAHTKAKTKKGLAKKGTATEFDVVVWDESHRLKNPAAARSKLAAKLTQAAGFSLWLSATAGQNPLELSYLSALLAKATGESAKDLKDFEAWCLAQGLGVTRGAYGRWDWRGDPADCDKVRALLFDAHRSVAAGLRRRPEDIAGWPELNRMLTPVTLEGEARALYHEAWTTFRKELQLEHKGGNPKSALAATLRLRQKGSLLRVPGTVELTQELLEAGHQVAISVAFIETLTALQTALGETCAVIHGALPAAEKERQRMRFQRGEATVVIFTVEEGISLHQGEHNDVVRSEVIHDLRWSAIQMAQIEGRCHRDGRFAQVYWTYADDTLEERIATIVCRRITAMKGMVGDDVETLREIQALLQADGAA